MNKILHLTHTDILHDGRILKEIGALISSGYKVSGIGVISNEETKKSSVPFEQDITSIRLKSREMKLLPKTLRHFISLCEFASKVLPLAISQKPNFIHCHDALMLPIGVAVKVLVKAKLIYDAHELESDRNGITLLQGWLTFFVEKVLWWSVDALITVSPSIDMWYQEKIGPKRSVIILNSPIISRHAPHKRDYLRKKFLIPKEQKIFIYVGLFGPNRGIELITKAFALSTITSHVIFLGYGNMAGELKELAAIHPNIHVHAAVPHSDVVSIVQSADFGLCLIENISLSDYYCLPNKLFEYCFSNVPVLASDFPDIRAVILDYKIGEFCSLDINAIRGSLEHMEKNYVKKFNPADLAPLSWQAQEQKLLDLYRGLLEN